jgi:GT2 family glycosyltransferase
MHNEAIAQLDAEQIVMLNNDVYAFSPGWLEQLVATLELDSAIAGVGGKLLYPDGTIQHAGMVIGSYRGLASNVGGGAPGDSAGYFGRHRALQQVSGVTAAMMIVRRSAYLAVGGFDAQRYPTSYNDVDLWLRLGDAGFRCLFNPAVQATHEESKTRGVSEQEFEFRRRLQEDLQRRGWRDPFWNLALFENPDDLLLKEKSGTWICEKMQNLRQQVELLRGPISDAGSASNMPASHLARFRNAAAGLTNSRIHNE